MKLATLAVACLLAVGCSMKVTVKPSPTVRIDKAHDISAAVLLDDAASKRVHSESRCVFETGKGLVTGSKKTFGRLFSEVTIVKSVGEFNPETSRLLVQPSINSFSFNSFTDAVRVNVGCRITDADGKSVYDGNATGSADRNLGNWTGSAFDRPQRLSDCASEAFNKAFAALADDIQAKADLTSYIRK